MSFIMSSELLQDFNLGEKSDRQICAINARPLNYLSKKRIYRVTNLNYVRQS